MLELERLRELRQDLARQIGRVVFGAEGLVNLCLAAVMVRGHVLLEGPPGVAKTLLARLLAKSLGMQLRRVQCTPDLMPGDVIGANLFDFRSQSFHLTRGPVFTEFLLADEINRMPPKTQAALLEAMQERSVTIDGVSHTLSPRFFVMATQNPIEHEGTYPLPEAQLDRFLFKLTVGYPDADEEAQAVTAHCQGAAMPDLEALGIAPIASPEAIDALREIPGQVRIEEDVIRYAVSMARATREHRSLAVGLSPRAAVMLAAAGRAMAALEGRDYAIPDDVKSIFLPVACHRTILAPGAELEGIGEEDVLLEVRESVQPPR